MTPAASMETQSPYPVVWNLPLVQPPADFIVLSDGPREVLRVKYPDGSVEFGEGATQDEASRLFWKHLGGFIAQRIAEGMQR